MSKQNGQHYKSTQRSYGT